MLGRSHFIEAPPPSVQAHVTFTAPLETETSRALGTGELRAQILEAVYSCAIQRADCFPADVHSAHS